MTKDSSHEAELFVSKLPDRLQAVEDEANQGCGQSYELYESRVQDAYSDILDEAPESVKPKVEAILKERGYTPDFEPYQAGENECDLTGIEIDCCPCGRHP